MTTPTRRPSPTVSPTRALERLVTLKAQYGTGIAATKLALLDRLASSTLRTAADVLALHEALVFLHAYPDEPRVFERAAAMLESFDGRPDVVRHRPALENSGLAGTDLVYPFGAPTARWLAARCGPAVTVEWDQTDTGLLEARLPQLTLWGERAVFDEPPLPMRPWLERLRGSLTDAAFLVARSAATTGTSLLGDHFYDELGLTLRVAAGPASPNRTRPRFPRPSVACQPAPLRTGRPDLRAVIRTASLHVADVGRRDAGRLVDLARESMVTRKRDLYSFTAVELRDVRLIDCGDGLELACFGVKPEQRLLLDAVYSFLMLRNGVPIGYALASALWRSSEIAFNVFESFRNAEAAWVYARLLAAMHVAFDVDTFTIFPYQLGHENDEGLESGAWWFYYKLGFRPRDPAAAALAEREAERVRRRPSYRTGAATLRRLVRANLFFDLGDARADVIGSIPTERIGLRVSDLVGSRFGADRERAADTLADEAAGSLGVPDWRQWPSGERLFWERWAPLVALLPGLEEWSPADREALVEVIRAKGGRREGDFVLRFDAHPRIGAALAALARA